LITRSYDRDIDGWGVEVKRISKTNGTSSYWEPAIEGDTLSCRVYTNIYTTADNGTLTRYVNETTGYVSGTTTTSAVLFNETFRVYVDEELIDNFTTDENGFFNMTTEDLGKTGYVSLAFENDMYSKRYETSLRIIKDGETSVNTYPAGDNAVEVYLSSESGKPLNEGNLSLYYTSQADSDRTLLDSWDMSTEGEANKTSFSKTITDLNGTLPAGYYFFTAEYTCESGYLKNATEESYSDSKGTLVGSEGYTAVDLMAGSSKNTLEVHMESIGGNINENCSISLYYRKVSGGSNTLLRNWTFNNESDYYNDSYFWGDANVSALDEGKYEFTVIFNCTDGTLDNSTISKVMDVPVIPEYDAQVSIAQGSAMSVKLGSPDFTINATALKTGSNEGWYYKSSNQSVATVSDEGVVHPVAVGQTNITVMYSSDFSSGSATLLLTVTEASSGNGSTPGNGTTPGNSTTPTNGSTSGNDAPANSTTPTNGSASGNDAPANETTPENKTEAVLVEVAPIVMPEQNVSVAMAYTDSVPFTGNKFKSKDVVAEGNGTYSIANVTVKINTTIMSFAQPVFKFKNIKHATARSGKKSSVTVTFKAVKGATKAQKKQISALNKVLKKQKMEFTLEQVDISKATDATYTANKKMTRVSKAELTVDGITYKLKNKSDYSAVITNSTISLTGNGDYKNTYVIPLNNG
ncbi:MAG: Ig-like domain-containing protein, partial [Lachnospiraceae bacterium]|nr:Ig-like domain-containing protein [Lachnospiraceae bacterium]